MDVFFFIRYDSIYAEQKITSLLLAHMLYNIGTHMLCSINHFDNMHVESNKRR